MACFGQFMGELAAFCVKGFKDNFLVAKVLVQVV